MPPRKYILCVDDHADTCYMLQLLLGFEGYETQFAATATEAMELAQVKSFDLYLLDSRLPDRSGVELCSELRMLFPHTPILIYSGDAYPKQHSVAMRAGATAYVDKPNVDQLLVSVRDLLTSEF